ncbi:MAG: hypothetical protein ACW99Q_23035, partial [Candidatus Kariarchaeaceae archaeon]
MEKQKRLGFSLCLFFYLWFANFTLNAGNRVICFIFPTILTIIAQEALFTMGLILITEILAM